MKSGDNSGVESRAVRQYLERKERFLKAFFRRCRDTLGAVIPQEQLYRPFLRGYYKKDEGIPTIILALAIFIVSVLLAWGANCLQKMVFKELSKKKE